MYWVTFFMEVVQSTADFSSIEPAKKFEVVVKIAKSRYENA